MILFSSLKALILGGVDALSGQFPPFERDGHKDAGAPTRAQIAAAAEQELEAFVWDGAYLAQTPNDLGDACIWQGVYTAMCVRRWQATKEAKARAQMLLACAALAKYVRAGVLHRGAMPTKLLDVAFHKDPTKTYLDDVDGYTYRDDASLDSLAGFCYGAATVMTAGDDEAKAIVRRAATALSNRFTDDGYRLVNRDGSRTRYGNCAPGLFQAPVRVMAACLPSLLAGFTNWSGIAERHAPEFRTPDTQIPKKFSWVNAHLAMLTTLSFVMLTSNHDAGNEQARSGLDDMLERYAEAGNSFLVFGAAAAGLPIASYHHSQAAQILAEFPLAGKPFTPPFPKNSQPTPVHLRPRFDVVWQRSPYEQGGGEHPDIKLNRMDFLLAHYCEAISMKKGIS